MGTQCCLRLWHWLGPGLKGSDSTSRQAKYSRAEAVLAAIGPIIQFLGSEGGQISASGSAGKYTVTLLVLPLVLTLGATDTALLKRHDDTPQDGLCIWKAK